LREKYEKGKEKEGKCKKRIIGERKCKQGKRKRENGM
jgi:hypothetical protein